MQVFDRIALLIVCLCIVCHAVFSNQDSIAIAKQPALAQAVSVPLSFFIASSSNDKNDKDKDNKDNNGSNGDHKDKDHKDKDHKDKDHKDKDHEDNGNQDHRGDNDDHNGSCGVEQPNRKPDPKPQDFNLIIIPIHHHDERNGRCTPDTMQPIHPVAGQPFSVFVAVVDSQNRVIEYDGEFQFHWSAHNYVNPSKPHQNATPVGIHGWFDLQDGSTVIQNVRYDEAGVIKFTGMARIRIPIDNQGQNKKDEDEHGHGHDGDDNNNDNANTKTQVVIDEGEPFVVQPYDFLVTIVPDTPSDDEVYTAGERFSLVIQTINALGEPIENYPASGSNDELFINLDIVVPGGARDGELLDLQGNTVETIAANAFSNGSAAISNLRYSETGVLEIRIEDSGCFGLEVKGEWHHIGRFIPDHFALDIEQPALSGNPDTSYNYSGQPFDATVTITAENGFEPPDVTQNYYGSIANFGEDSLSVLLQNTDRSKGPLTAFATQTPFLSGQSIASITDIVFTFASPREPESLRLDYRFQDADAVTGQALGPSVEFRCGRIRFRGNQGIAGDFMDNRMEIEYFYDTQWQLNRDEERLTVRLTDLALSGSNQSISLLGNERTVFAGHIRGGTQPFQIQASGIASPVGFTVGLSESSELKFLDTVPEPWKVFPSNTIASPQGHVVRKRYVYHAQN